MIHASVGRKTPQELQQRTFRFAVQVYRFVRPFTRGPETRHVAHQLRLSQEAEELIRIFAAAYRTSKAKRGLGSSGPAATGRERMDPQKKTAAELKAPPLNHKPEPN